MDLPQAEQLVGGKRTQPGLGAPRVDSSPRPGPDPSGTSPPRENYVLPRRRLAVVGPKVVGAAVVAGAVALALALQSGAKRSGAERSAATKDDQAIADVEHAIEIARRQEGELEGLRARLAAVEKHLAEAVKLAEERENDLSSPVRAPPITPPVRCATPLPPRTHPSLERVTARPIGFASLASAEPPVLDESRYGF
jgi:hypothetical protein